jgi:hypothetical protein
VTTSSNKYFIMAGITFALYVVAFIEMSMADSTQSAYALTRYINCVTKVANNNGTLSVTDVTRCYDKVFIGAHDDDEFGHPLK